MNHRTARGLGSILAVAMPLTLAAVTAPAASAQPQRNSQAVSSSAVRPNAEFVNIALVYKHWLGHRSGDWKNCEYVTAEKYHQRPSCSRGVTVSESYSGSLGASKDWYSATLGFNISYSKTESDSNTFYIKPGGHGWVQMGFRYSLYKVGVHRRMCNASTGICGAWSKTYVSYVQHHLGQTYRYHGTGAI